MNAANHVVRGGVCISLNMQGMNAVMKDAQTRWSRVEEFVRHGAKVKRCSREGCTNQVQEEKLSLYQAWVTVKQCEQNGCTNNGKEEYVGDMEQEANK